MAGLLETFKRAMFEKAPYEAWKEGNCVSDVLYGAKKYSWDHDIPLDAEHFRVARIKVDPEKNVDHVQLQVKEDGDKDWRWLTTHHGSGQVIRWTPHFPIEPYEYLPVEQFAKQQEGIEHVVPKNMANR